MTSLPAAFGGRIREHGSKMSDSTQHPTSNSQQAVSLEHLRLRIYATVFPIGVAALSLITILENIEGLATPVERILHPLLAVLFGLFAVAVSLRRSLLRPLEVISFTIVSLYMLLELYRLLYESYAQHTTAGFATFPQWLPMVYFLGFLIFRTKSAIIVSICFLAAAVVPGAMYLLAFGPESLRFPEFRALIQVYLSHSIYIPLLSGNSVLKERYMRAAMFAESMLRVANRDYLTKIDNRRYLEETLTLSIERARRYGRSLMVIVIDIDHFKRINDNYGHDVGDDVLIEMATLIREHLRTADSFGRWGGEEFLVIAPEIGISRAVLLAERLRTIIEHHSFGIDQRLTASFGVTGYRAGDTVDSLVKRADIALYRAKQSGRNRVELEG
jgi:diguanylate cyclase (GGDEF)-like protein